MLALPFVCRQPCPEQHEESSSEANRLRRGQCPASKSPQRLRCTSACQRCPSCVVNFAAQKVYHFELRNPTCLKVSMTAKLSGRKLCKAAKDALCSMKYSTPSWDARSWSLRKSLEKTACLQWTVLDASSRPVHPVLLSHHEQLRGRCPQQDSRIQTAASLFAVRAITFVIVRHRYTNSEALKHDQS